MTDLSSTGTRAGTTPEAATSGITVEHPPPRAQRSGWTTFAGVIMVIAGISRIFDSVWAFQYHRVLPEDLQGALFGTSLDTYAWIWLTVGIVLTVVGLGIAGVGFMADSQVGRWIGVVAAGIGALTAMSWMAFYPIWSLMYVAVAVVVIYALIVHPARAAHT